MKFKSLLTTVILLFTGFALSAQCDASFSHSNAGTNAVLFNVNNPSNGNTYVWFFGDGNSTSTTQPSVAHTYPSAGSYAATLSVTNSSTSCFDSSYVPIQATNQTYNHLLYGSIEYPGGAPVANQAISWSFYTAPQINNPMGVVTSDPSGVFIDTLNLTAQNGLLILSTTDCDNTVLTDTVQITPATGTMLTPHITYCDTASAPLCDATFSTQNAGTNAVFLEIDNPISGNSYYWDFGDGNSQTTSQHHVWHTYSSSGSYGVTSVALNGGNPCDTSTSQVQATNQMYTFIMDGHILEYGNLTPVAGKTINWSFHTGPQITNPSGFTISNASGYYRDTLSLPAQNGWLTVSTLDCDSSILSHTLHVTPTGTDLLNNHITYCYPSGPFCQAGFTVTNNSSGNTLTFSADTNYQYIYNWDFGDGNTASNASPYITYQYQNSGVYQVCLEIIRSGTTCKDTVCHSVVASGSGNTPISGLVYAGNNLADHGTAYLIEYDSTGGGILTAIDTAQIQQGVYTFGNVPQGAHLVKAALSSNSAYYSNYMPSYHARTMGSTSGVLYWSQATPIWTGQINPMVMYDIHLVQGNNPGGPGFIGGSVLQGANKISLEGEPIDQALIVLRDENEEPVDYTYSDASGKFEFDGVALGKYDVYTEVPGIETYPLEVELTGSQTRVDNLYVAISPESVSGGTVSVADINGSGAVSVYPNPATDQLTVEMPEVNGQVQFKLIDVVGKNVMSGPVNSTIERIDVNELPAGIYMLEISDGALIHQSKIVKE